MKRALIATLYNEADNVRHWWDCILKQDTQPDEIVIVDGGSKDGTWEQLQGLGRQSSVPVRLKQQRCNIAEGRNLAIKMTDAEVIASTDAGSFPQPAWFGEITKPLMSDVTLDVVGGLSSNLIANDFHRLIAILEGSHSEEPKRPEDVYPSSRNIAFRRSAWANVGGYPEWLTLTAEDALFNFNLHQIGCRFFYNREAVVVWMAREDARAYFRMLHSYGYGAAEARLYAPFYLRRILIAFCPLLLLLSRWRWRHFGFRYRKNLASATGWIMGWCNGHRAPRGWQKINGVMLSPQSLDYLAKRGSRTTI